MRISDWSSDVCSSDLERCSIGSDRIGGGKAPGEVVGSAHRRHHLVAGGKQRSRQVSTDEAVGPRQQYAPRRGPPRAPCYSLGAVSRRITRLATREAAAGPCRRSEARRVGKEGGSTGRTRWWP